ncbi:MAG TPA: YicC/YloC family endoribonuclease, partial [Rhodothermales bacterium]|nr:YicC/YloC family endoribonuclease [Rhodothermales bacterium]
MTGFGRGTATVDGATATVEVRTVNGRFLEVKTRLPRPLSGRDADVERLVRTRLERGSVTVGVTLEREATGTAQVDAEAARRYADLLRAVAAAAGIEEPLRLDHLLRFPDVLAVEVAQEADPSAWAAAEAALVAALDDLAAMRTQEGAALEADLRARLARLDAMTAEAEARSPLRLDEARTRLRARLDDLL